VDVLSLSDAFIIMGIFFIVLGGLSAVKINRICQPPTNEKAMAEREE
jgi:hypothetical protein